MGLILQCWPSASRLCACIHPRLAASHQKRLWNEIKSSLTPELGSMTFALCWVWLHLASLSNLPHKLGLPPCSEVIFHVPAASFSSWRPLSQTTAQSTLYWTQTSKQYLKNVFHYQTLFLPACRTLVTCCLLTTSWFSCIFYWVVLI